MKNYVKEGNMLTAPAPAGGVVSGTPYLIGAILGIAASTQAAGTDTEFRVTGVFIVPKATGQAWTVGTRLYWDATNKNLTTIATGNILVGCVAAAAVSTDTAGMVRLNGSA